MSFTGYLLGHLAILGTLGVLAMAAGRPVARWLAIPGKSVPSGMTLACGLALGSQALLLLGLVGALRTVVLVPLLLGLAACGFLGSPTPAGLRPRVALGLSALAAPVFLLALYPPLGFDQTMYHLPFAQAFAATGGVPFLPHLRFPAFPVLAELLTTPLVLWTGEVSSQLVGLLALGATAALAFAWAREHAPRGAWLAPAVLVGSPAVLYLSTCGYVEPVLALFGLAALYAAERSREEDSRSWATVAGGLAGSAAGVKYLGLPFLPAALVLLWPRESWRRDRWGRNLATLGLFSLAGALALIPTYGRLLALTGNPLFPFYPEFFGDNPWAADQFLGARGSSHLAQAATLLGDITFRRQTVGALPPFSPAFVLGLPLGLLAAWHRPALRRWLLVALGCLVLAPTNAHYFLAFAPLWGILLAAGADALPWPPRRWLAIGALGVALVGPAWALHRIAQLGLPPAGPEGRRQLLARELPLYRAVSYLAQETPGGTVYGIRAERMVAYFPGTLLGDYNGPHSFAQLAARAQTLGSVATALQEFGASHLLVTRHDPEWVRRAAADPFLVLVYGDEEAVVYRLTDRVGGYTAGFERDAAPR